MYYQQIVDSAGAYVTENGERCDLMSANAVHAKFVAAWTWFDTLEACLAAWGLTYDPLPETEPEN